MVSPIPLSRRIMWAAFFVAAFSSFAKAEDTPQRYVDYRLMSYNVGSAANLPLGPRQIGQIAETIIDNRVDIAGLTEMETGTCWHDHRDQVAELCVALADRGYPMHVYKWAQMKIAGGWFTPALLSRLPIEENGYYIIDPPAGYRWCVGYITVHVAQNTAVRAHMTHFWPHGDPKAVEKAVGKLASLPNQWSGPRTIMGDFNLTPEQPLYKVVTAKGWQSSCEALHGAPCLTVQGMYGVAGPLPLNSQLDYIFGSADIEFVDSYVGYFSMSDHWPIFAQIRVKANGPPTPTGLPDTSVMGPKGRVARAQAAALYRNHDYPKAAAAYRNWEEVATDKDAAGFAAYSAASMDLLAGKPDAAIAAFIRVTNNYPGTEWSTRSRYRLAFLHKNAKQWQPAEDAFLAFLEGYYRYIHPNDPKATVIRITATEIAICRTARGNKTGANAVLDELSQKEPQDMVARSAAYWIGHEKVMNGDSKGALPYLLKAAPNPNGLRPHEAEAIIRMYEEAGRSELARPFKDYCDKWSRS